MAGNRAEGAGGTLLHAYFARQRPAPTTPPRSAPVLPAERFPPGGRLPSV